MESQKLNDRVMLFSEFMDFLQRNDPNEYIPEGYNLCPISALAWPGYSTWIISNELAAVLQRGV